MVEIRMGGFASGAASGFAWLPKKKLKNKFIIKSKNEKDSAPYVFLSWFVGFEDDESGGKRSIDSQQNSMDEDDDDDDDDDDYNDDDGD